jgi:hypothetical protein
MEDKKKPPVDVVAKTTMIGHLLIRDKETKEILVNQRDGIVHQGIILGSQHARNAG